MKTLKNPESNKDEIINDNQLSINVKQMADEAEADKKMLKRIIKDETKGPLKHPIRFWLIVLWLCIGQFSVGFNQAFVGSFVVTLTNKKNFDWEKDSKEYIQNVSLLTSLYFLGCAIGTLTLNLFIQMNQRKFLVLLQLFTILISGIICIQNDITFIIGRLFMGYIAGLVRPALQTFIFQLSPPELRQKAISIYAMMLNCGMFVAVVWSFLDDGGTFMWRLAILIQMIPSSLFVIFSLTCFKNIDLPSNMISMKKETEVEKMMQYYMKDSQVTFLIKKHKESIESEKQQYEKIKGRKCGKIRFLVSYYNKEFTYGIYLAIASAFTMLNCYMQFILKLMVEDENDDAQLKTGKLLNASMFLIILLAQLILAVSNLNK